MNANVSRNDFFQTHNRFWGGQLGARGEYGWGRFSISVDGQVALGTMEQSVSIDGFSVGQINALNAATTPFLLAGIPLVGNYAPPGAIVSTPISNVGTVVAPGGVYAQPTNMGHYTRSAFAVVPEGIVKLNYRFTDRLTGSVGYTFLWMSTVARPGEQVNPVVNPGLLQFPQNPAGVAQPALFGIQTSSYWVQGMTMGVELKF